MKRPPSVEPLHPENLRVIRNAAGLSLERLAALVRDHDGNVTIGFLSKVENGTKGLSPENAEALRQALSAAIGKPVTYEALFKPTPVAVDVTDDGHGTTRRYSAGCRCETCRLAWRLYIREYRAKKAAA